MLFLMLACAMPEAVLADPPSQTGEERMERPVAPKRAAEHPEPSEPAAEPDAADETQPGGVLHDGVPNDRGGASAPLTDDHEIIAMVQRRIRDQLPDLDACDDGQGGRWTLRFVVARGGAVAEVDVTPLGESAADIENCIFDRVQQWSFEPIKSDLPIKKTVSFAVD